MDKSQEIAIKAVTMAEKYGSAAIIVNILESDHVHLAHAISKYRPRNIILAVTKDPRIARQCHLYSGILPVLYKPGTIRQLILTLRILVFIWEMYKKTTMWKLPPTNYLLVKSYLSDRKFLVRFASYLSSIANINAGV